MTERWYKQWKRCTVHPDLKVDYFHNVNNREKAYWLGVLYSDGCISKHHTSIQIQIELNQGDECLIDRFCECVGLDKTRKRHRIRETDTESVTICFICRKMGEDLLRHGLKFEKSRTIEYPKSLGTRDLELAFLLGYYDGDGAHHTTRITSGSIRFLKQARKRFNLPYKIRREEGGGEICGRKIRGIRYRMFLGAELFNEMMENYTDSMPRKRWFPCDSKERLRRSAEACTPEMNRKRKDQQGSWRAITENELGRMVWEMPLAHIAAKYSVNAPSVAKKCKKYDIPRPERGYWTKRRSLETRQNKSSRRHHLEDIVDKDSWSVI